GLRLQHPGREHQEARRAEAALQPVMLPERLLQRMKLFVLRQALDGADLCVPRLNGEHQARANRFAVDEHRAGSAHPVLAAKMRAGDAAIVAQRHVQAAPRGHPHRIVVAVDAQRESNRLAQALTSRSLCRMRCGVTGISKNSMPKGESASTMALITAAGAPMAP